METILNTINQVLTSTLANEWIFATVFIMLKMYAGLARPSVPSFLSELMNNVFFRIFVYFLVLYFSTRDVMISIVVSSSMIIGLDYLNQSKEGFENNLIEELKEKYMNLFA
jgi:hypothetical protein